VKRILIIVGIGLGALALVLVTAWWWLTTTSSGAGFLLARAQPALERFDYQHVEGGLRGGMVLTEVYVEQAGAEVQIGRLELAARVRLFPLGLTVRRLRLDRVELVLPPASPATEPPEPFELGDYRAPLEVRVDELAVRDFRFISDPDGAPLEIQSFDFAGRYADALTIDALALALAPATLTAEGEIGLANPWAVDLELDAGVALAPEHEQHLRATVTGEAAALALKLETTGPAELDGTARLLGLPQVDALSAEVAVAGNVRDWPEMPAEVEGLTLDASGGLDDWQARFGGRLSWPELPSARLTLVARGDANRIELAPLTIEALEGRIDVEGQALLDEALTAEARVNLSGLDFTALYPEWPNQVRLGGDFDVAWDGNTLSLKELALHAPPSALDLSGQASYVLDREHIDVALEWQALTWPPVIDEGQPPLFSSQSGRFEGRGGLAEWRAELDAWLQLPDQPRARLDLRASGDAEQAEIAAANLDLERAGRILISGDVDWRDTVAAELEIGLQQFDPAAFVPELPGAVDADLMLSLTVAAPIAGEIRIDTLTGQLRQVALSGNGAFAFAGNRVQRGDLRLALGENRLALSSDTGEDWRLNLDAEQLNQLWPELNGQLTIAVLANPFSRAAEWTASSTLLAWQDFRLQTLESEGALNWGAAPSAELMLQARDVDLNPWERLDQVELNFSGACDAHRFGAYLSGTRATLDLAASGRLPGCLDDPEVWVGQLERLTLSDTPMGGWQLDGALPIELDQGTVRAGPGCLWTAGDEGRMCLNELSAGEDGSAVVAFNALPLDLLLLPADPVFTVGSRLRGLLELGWGQAGITQIESTLLLGPGDIELLDADNALLHIRGGDLRLHSPAPGALDGDLAFRFEQRSEITGSVSIPDLNALETTEIDARADLSLPNLGAFNRLLPQLDRLAGRLDAGIEVFGPVLEPEFDGRVAISQGEFLYAPLGMHLEDLGLELNAHDEGGDLAGSFQAGDGRGEISGQLQASESGWGGEAHIHGEALEMFNADWLKMTLSPSFDLAFDPSRLTLDGVLAVDRARIGMPPGAESRVPVSEDVIIANADDSDPESEASTAQIIEGQVKLRLGDDVRLNAAGMQTRLTGGLDLIWTPESTLPEGQGIIRLVDGSYRAYGQNLEVTVGQVVFTGNPIDNPVVGVEAVREIFGDPQVEQAGVRILGPAQEPEIELFTDPPTSREQALAYVLTGAQFDHAGGQGAFSVGFWVLPQLFVSYGLGLFDSGNVLAARYELSRRWGVRATSGERDTGVDVSFIIDR